MNKQLMSKIGWLGGWIGGFIWIIVLSIKNISAEDTINGVIGIFLFTISMSIIYIASPWRYPGKKIWLLLMPIYIMISLSLIWALTMNKHYLPVGYNKWNLLALLPILSPIFLMGKFTWYELNIIGSQKNN